MQNFIFAGDSSSHNKQCHLAGWLAGWRKNQLTSFQSFHLFSLQSNVSGTPTAFTAKVVLPVKGSGLA